MNIHKDARLTPQGRAPISRTVDQGWRVADAAQARVDPAAPLSAPERPGRGGC